ncbi:MAG TPA: phosphate ABC transporter permease PstA [Nocardioides sp.]|uniref:phosphate ABC transporter permease PstA n=1 Tax=Nocardioides sp. TaxID=35761 RepID=UPI002E33E165|nr:phosphate ABC transporter permease PstA [Nocardioides sp.]HEX3931467.1 phosphate ABC transporter permease PstA [Nocardioides sp.]
MTAVLHRDDVPMDEAPRTVMPERAPDAAAPVPRTSLGVLPLEYRFLTWGARLGAVGLSWVIVERVLPIQGPGWFVVVAALCNAALLAVGTLVIDAPIAMVDRVAQWVVSAGALVVFSALASTLGFVFKRGWPALHHWNFFTQTMHTTLPDAPYNQGGVLQSVVGTLIEIGIAVAITLPLGVGTAVYMNEVGGRFARVIRTVVEAMTALPSIVAGLFIYSLWIITLHEPRSGFAGALAIGVMMLPIVARASDVVLRVVPGNLREASLGLGASRWRTIWHVVLPTARPGLATALILAVARGIGETSPVLIASGYATFLVTQPFHGVMSSLPLSVYNSVIAPEPQAVVRGYATAAVLLMLVLVLFVVARLLARPPSAKPSLRRRLMRSLQPARPRPEVAE